MTFQGKELEIPPDYYEKGVEFGLEEDPFLRVRKKGSSRWIIKHLFHKSNKFLVIFWLIFMITSTIAFSQLVVMLGDAVDYVITNFGNIFDPSIYKGLIRYVLLILAWGIIRPVLGMVGNFSRELLAQRMERDGRHEFYLNLLGKSQNFHDQQQVGEIMARTADDVRMLNYMVSPALALIGEAIASLVIPIVTIALKYPPQLAIIPTAFLIFLIFYVQKYFKRLGPVTRDLRTNFGEMNSVLNQTLSGIEVVKGLTLEEHETKKYLSKTRAYRDALIRQGIIEAKYLPILMMSLIVVIGLGHGILINLGYIPTSHSLEIGGIIGYVSLLVSLRRPTFISLWTFQVMRYAKSASERLLEMMNEEAEKLDTSRGKSLEIKGKVTFENVSFIYPKSKNAVLKNLNFEVLPGQTVAIVGTTGSGKTTCTKLVSRLYDVTTGEILIDGRSLQEYTLESLRSQISYIEQDVFLYATTIFENISFGRVSSMDEVVKAAKDAQAYDFIMKYPNEFQTKIGEGEDSVQLSGGERQRIAIARAFISNPKILILDDSTSAIDSATEDKIQHAMQKVAEGRTTFIITHRLSQIRWADKILVFKRGEIIAQGTHKELLKTSEEYRKIFLKRFDVPLEVLIKEDA
ncbi:MAG: ABC transporter ATP-binding protein [Candidatus Lokiarchaeota archaeon]|nr:ABC transporter ATP-binding protein [Candidatus Lokiarchaeota archaeon]